MQSTDKSHLVQTLMQRRRSRRSLLRAAGVASLGVMGAGLGTGSLTPQSAEAQRTVIDPDILNFALNLEYLEGEYYTHGVFGVSLTDVGVGVDGVGTLGGVTIKANPLVPFVTPLLQSIATDVALTERSHVVFLRNALGAARIARPAIDLLNSFNAVAVAAGLGNSFDPFASEENFFIGGVLFEDVGVTAYKGGSRLLTNKNNLENSAGILAVEAYNASTFRTILAQRGRFAEINAISDARDALDGPADLDQGLGSTAAPNIVPADANAIAFSRTANQVLNVVYLSPTKTPGGFLPAGANGKIR